MRHMPIMTDWWRGGKRGKSGAGGPKKALFDDGHCKLSKLSASPLLFLCEFWAAKERGRGKRGSCRESIYAAAVDRQQTNQSQSI